MGESLATSRARPGRRRSRGAAAALGLGIGLLAVPGELWGLAPAPTEPSTSQPATAEPEATPSRTSSREPDPGAASSGAVPPTVPDRARRPHDPNDLPPMPAPYGQPTPEPLRTDLAVPNDRSARRRVELQAMPLYASFRLPFMGRPGVPVRGGGVGVAAGVALWKPFGLRALLVHSMHPVFDEFSLDDDDVPVQTAARGLVQATLAGLSASYTMDIGRVATTLDAGLGGMVIQTPPAVQDGQRGGTCRTDGVCDTGLVCGGDNICRVGLSPQLHGGFAIDVLMGDHVMVGGELRYHALITAPTAYPVYLIAAARVSLRF